MVKLSKYIFLILMMAVIGMSGCTSEDPVLQEVAEETNATDDSADSEDDGQDNGDNTTPEVPAPYFLIKEFYYVSVNKEEAERMGLYTVDRNDADFMSRILPERRMVVDMRNSDSMEIDLLSAASIDFYHARNYVSVELKDSTFYEGPNFWVHNPCCVDYGPVKAESLSPTRIRITKNPGNWSATKPVEIGLERLFLLYIPFEEGVFAKIIVTVSDTPADSRDSGDNHFISMAEADRLGLYHMPFDCEDFKAPLFATGDSITVEMPAEGDKITVELSSPASLYVRTDAYFTIMTSYSTIPLDGIRYFDIDDREWVFYPIESTFYGTTARMTDPYHVTISLDKLLSDEADEISVMVERGNLMHAPDAGVTSGIISVVRPKQ